MNALWRAIKTLVKSKNSRLHLVYFIDHSETRSISLQRLSILAISALLLTMIGSAFYGFIHFGQQAQKNQELTAQTLKLKNELLSYQLKYDGVWEKAYPESILRSQNSTPLAKAAVVVPEPKTPDQEKKTERQQVDPSQALAEKVTEKKPATPIPLPEKIAKLTKPVTDKPTPKTNTPSNEVAATFPKAEESKQIVTTRPQKKVTSSTVTTPVATNNLSVLAKNIKIKESQNGMQLKFDLVNRGSKKAKGLFYARLVSTSGKDTNYLYTHPEVLELSQENNKPHNSIPTFSVRSFRSCRLYFPNVSKKTTNAHTAQLFLTDRDGQIVFEKHISLRPTVAKSQKSKSTQQQ